MYTLFEGVPTLVDREATAYANREEIFLVQAAASGAIDADEMYRLLTDILANDHYKVRAGYVDNTFWYTH